MSEADGATGAVEWRKAGDYTDILYDISGGIARITINRPEVHNAFRPLTVDEMLHAFMEAHHDADIGVVLFTGAGSRAFCSGGDQRVRGEGGYVGDDGVPRLNVLPLQRYIRSMPKPVIALVNGYAIGGGHVLHVICDLSIASETAIFGQTGPRVGSFDAGLGATQLARIVGHKKAREIWFLCRQYSAQQALDMGLVNEVVPPEGARGRGRALGERDPRAQPDGVALPEDGLPRRHGRAGRHPAARRGTRPRCSTCRTRARRARTPSSRSASRTSRSSRASPEQRGACVSSETARRRA